MRIKVLIGVISLFCSMKLSVIAQQSDFLKEIDLFGNIKITDDEKQKWLVEIGSLKGELEQKKYIQIQSQNVSMYSYDNVDYVFINSPLEEADIMNSILTTNPPQSLEFVLATEKFTFGSIETYVLQGKKGFYIPINSLTDIYQITEMMNYYVLKKGGQTDLSDIISTTSQGVYNLTSDILSFTYEKPNKQTWEVEYLFPRHTYSINGEDIEIIELKRNGELVHTSQQPNYGAIAMEQEKIIENNTQYVKSEIFIKYETWLFEQARLEQEAKLKEEARLEEEAKLAEEARLEEAKLAQESLLENTQLTEEEKLDEQLRIAEETILTIMAKIETENKSVQEAKLKKEARLAQEAKLAEEIKLEIQAKIDHEQAKLDALTQSSELDFGPQTEETQIRLDAEAAVKKTILEELIKVQVELAAQEQAEQARLDAEAEKAKLEEQERIATEKSNLEDLRIAQVEKAKIQAKQQNLDAVFPPYIIKGKMKYATNGFKAGQEVTIKMAEDGTSYYLETSNGLVVVPWNSVSLYKDSPVEEKRATNEQIEIYINSLEFTSKTKHLVWTDLHRQRTYIFEFKNGKWVLFKDLLCSSGKNITPTPRGTYQLTAYVPYFGVDKGYMCKNAVQFMGDYLYHSIIYDKTGTYLLEGWGVLGERASQGCVRFAPDDSEWFYKTMKLGTTVYIN